MLTVSYTHLDVYKRQQLKDGDEVSDSVFPSYLSTFISEYFSLPAEDGFLYEDRLAALYYASAMESRNQFVSSWFGFNLTLNNICLFYTSSCAHP